MYRYFVYIFGKYRFIKPFISNINDQLILIKHPQIIALNLNELLADSLFEETKGRRLVEILDLNIDFCLHSR